MAGLLLAIAIAPGGSAAGARTERAAVTVVDQSPLVVAGRGFAPRERVLLRTVVDGRRYTKLVVARPSGRFTTRAADVDASCLPFTITAEGRTGTRAVVRRINIPPPCGIVIQP